MRTIALLFALGLAAYAQDIHVINFATVCSPTGTNTCTIQPLNPMSLLNGSPALGSANINSTGQSWAINFTTATATSFTNPTPGNSAYTAAFGSGGSLTLTGLGLVGLRFSGQIMSANVVVSPAVTKIIVNYVGFWNDSVRGGGVITFERDLGNGPAVFVSLSTLVLRPLPPVPPRRILRKKK